MLAFIKRLFRRKPKQKLPHCFDGGISQMDSNGKVLKRECLGHPGSIKCAYCEHHFTRSFYAWMAKRATDEECAALMHVATRLVEGKKPEAWAEEILKPKKPLEDNP